jgi:hypothetical protein
VQYDAEQAAMDRSAAIVAVIDEATLPELIHEVTAPRPGCADHRGKNKNEKDNI